MTVDNNLRDDAQLRTVPRQSEGRHDAYDIYAEIYALRMDDPDTAA